MPQKMLDTVRLRTHQERDTERHVRHEFTQHEHQSVGQYLPFVIDLLVDIAYRRDTGHQRTRIQNRQQS